MLHPLHHTIYPFLQSILLFIVLTIIHPFLLLQPMILYFHKMPSYPWLIHLFHHFSSPTIILIAPSTLYITPSFPLFHSSFSSFFYIHLFDRFNHHYHSIHSLSSFNLSNTPYSFPITLCFIKTFKKQILHHSIHAFQYSILSHHFIYSSNHTFSQCFVLPITPYISITLFYHSIHFHCSNHSSIHLTASSTLSITPYFP